MGKKPHLFVSSMETFRDDGTPESKTRYDREGNEIHRVMYDEKGRPLSGICGDFMRWEMKNSHTIIISGDGDMDNFSVTNPPPWQMHEIAKVILEEGIQSVGTHAFTSVHTNMHVTSLVIPQSLNYISLDAFCGSEIPAQPLSPYWK